MRICPAHLWIGAQEECRPPITKIDAPCGAVSVGIFADGTYGSGWNGVGAATYLGHTGQGVTGLLYGDTRQFLCQLGGATLCALWAFGATYLVFSAVNTFKSMRVSPEVEHEGLDVPEFGMTAYPEDAGLSDRARVVAGGDVDGTIPAGTRRYEVTTQRWLDGMNALTLFGLIAVTAMLVCYTLEKRSHWFILAFAVSCAMGSVYGFLQGAWPFGLVEAVWSVVAARRWWTGK